MPELSIENMRMCKTCEEWQANVVGSDGMTKHTVRFGRDFEHRTSYEYAYSCSCPAFKYSRTPECKHIRNVVRSKLRCGWHQQIDGGEVIEADGKKVCPRCGGETVAIQVAV